MTRPDTHPALPSSGPALRMSTQGGGLPAPGAPGEKVDGKGEGSVLLIIGLLPIRDPIRTPSPKATSRSPVTMRIGRRFIAHP